MKPPLAFERRLLLIFVFAAGRLVDLLTTAVGLSVGKAELNPLVHAFGMNALYVFDVALLVGFVLAAWRVKLFTVDVFLITFAALVIAGAIWNLLALLVI